MIFASLNYRLGPLGFPQGIEAARRQILNLGLQDQLAGLQWLHSNVHGFGGDSSKVPPVCLMVLFTIPEQTDTLDNCIWSKCRRHINQSTTTSGCVRFSGSCFGE